MSIPTWDQLPNFDLYKDQTVNVVNEASADYGGIISASMINNYVKQKLIDPPIKKKYNRTHVAQLIFINLMKGIFTLEEIITLKQHLFLESQIEDHYNEFIELFNERLSQTTSIGSDLPQVLDQLSGILIAKRQIKNLLQDPISEP
ncbi:DUF1836 domain-containing protein [Xylocopilactobacillus apicola]|uniref:DUF1836 domain-containing protein n=1 Tax=Xylocopilactobacillus apicola TaxID=2932184 RepID=A0AAU9D4I1_9LACO|nr:DUF1836 domain-containing protein [Xylocopilactobacillus apicola]BDR58674.1 hypothetical protein XA3_11150 [Xylocopilactobacillus apicola]